MHLRRLRAWARFAACMLVCLAAAPASAQQAGTGTLTGTIVDATGGAMPGATASATELATGAVRTNVANEAGIFRIPALPPGQYTLKVELSGFKAVTVTGIQLLTTEVRDLGRLTLEVGAQSESITVTAEVTPVQTATSSRFGSITGDQLTNIQMKGRDIYGLLAVLPGVMDTNLNRDFSTWTSMRDVTINGNPVTSKNVVVDGMSVVDEGGTGNAFVNPNIDAVGEVQVIANGYTAENGRNNGGLIQMTTKSGTSRFSGSAFYNIRRDRWNAIDYFRKATGLRKPLYRVNIPGYSIGGPILIPGLLTSASERKFYFFGSQEFTDDAKPSGIARSNLPTALERNGDFSQTRYGTGAGQLNVINDPLTGQPFPGNVIPANRINPLGSAMLNLLPQPNGVLNPAAGQEWTSNSAFENNPLHSRTNHVLRLDVVYNRNLRGSFKFMRDREDNISNNQFAPGLGVVNNFVPGWTYSGSVTQVIRPNVVNEMTGGFGHNNYGFKGDYDYKAWYRSALGVDPPRLEPFGAYQDPPAVSKKQADEYPYYPITSFAGGNRTGYATFSPGAVNGRVMPAANRNDRWSFQDDLSITHNRHNLKFGFYTEYTLKTEPGSTDYMGNYNFGHVSENPQSTGNGYANALLGNFQTYSELSNRLDKDRRHWQTEAYVQDSWRMNARFTLDYGVRLTHSGAFFEVNNANTGFDPGQWQRSLAPRLYRPACTTGVPGNLSCATANQRTIDPGAPGTFFPLAFQGNIVPGSGQQVNGVIVNGLPGMKKGQYFDFPYLVAAPRVGFAWDLAGDGKTALRSSAGIFYNYPRGGYSFEAATAPVVQSRVIRWGSFADITNATTGGTTKFVENPIAGNVVGGRRDLDKSYNVNVALQRDLGFNTVAEAAYVGNFTWIGGRTVDDNAAALYAYADPNNLFNGSALNVNFLRTAYPGMGAVNRFVNGLSNYTLKYNALQLSANRRLSRGLQLGAAYTLSKGEGITGFDQYTYEMGGEDAIRKRYWGPTDVDRRHNFVFNYSYLIPSPMKDSPIVTAILGDWQVSGVTKFLSGTAVTPSCSSTVSGVATAQPSLTPGVTSRCNMVGDPFAFTPDTSLPFPDQIHFNTAAFVLARPTGGIGDFGNTPVGILRNPSYSNWDVTLARRFRVPALGRNAMAKVQIQVYNVFNQVQFLNMGATYSFNATGNTNANTGKYVDGTPYGTTPPRQVGVTLRFDF